MRFRPARVNNLETGTQAFVWEPDIYSIAKTYTRSGSLVTAEVGRQRRMFDARLVDIAAAFMRTRGRREQLGHDCAVFALACATDNLFSDTTFNRPGGKIVKIKRFKYDTDGQEEPATEVGEITFTADTDPVEDDFLSAPHLLVRANVDQDTPLYFSKLGRSGPVVLSTFASMAEYYTVTTAGTAEGLCVAAYE
jgi:hypothetical protein